MTPSPNRQAPSSPLAQRGFSLLEIMIVIVLIGVIVALVGAKIFGANDNAKVHLAQVQVDTIASKIEQYQSDTGGLPPNLEALVKAPGGVNGWLGPYTREKDLKDPWSHALEYKVPGESGAFDVISLGRDGKPGGESVDADIRHQ